MTGYRISDDEAGFIALHIHSGLSDEAVSETLKATQLIDESMQIIEEHLEKEMQKEALNYIRLMSHLYYMVVRARSLRRQRKYLTRSMEIFYFRWQITLHLPRGGREYISFESVYTGY